MTQAKVENQTPRPDGNTPHGVGDAWHLLGRSLGDLLQLLRAEIAESASRVPDMLLLWVLHVPALVLMWVSFSLLPAWTAYRLSEAVFAGLLTFFIMQVFLVVAVNRSMKRKLKAASLPRTRHYAGVLMTTLLADMDMPTAANDERAGQSDS